MDRLEVAAVLANLDSTSPADKRLGSLPTDDWFLCELRKILDDQWIRDIVSWLPEGKIWRVHDLVAFQTIVLPRMPVIKDFGSPLDLFLAYTKVQGFQEISRGLNSIAFYHQGFSRYPLRKTSGAPLKEIYVAQRGPNTTPTAALVIDESTTKTLSKNNKVWTLFCKPLPPPPLTLANPRVANPARVVDKDAPPQNRHKITYLVESSARKMNPVKLNRSENTTSNPRPTEEISTLFTVDLPKVSRETSPDSSPTFSSKRWAPIVHGTTTPKAKKPRKKWLPSLGPPESDSLRILAKAAAVGSWFCNNAELFSASAALNKQ